MILAKQLKMLAETYHKVNMYRIDAAGLQWYHIPPTHALFEHQNTLVYFGAA